MSKEQVYKDIIKECYWDYNIDAKKIEDIVKSDDLRLKLKLLNKIISNSTDKIKSLTIFDRAELRRLLDMMDTEREIVKLIRNALFGEKNVVKRLQWKKR